MADVEIVTEIGKRLTSMLRCSPRVADPAEAIKELWAQPSHILSATEDGAVADGSRGGGGDEAAVGDDNRLPTADVSPHSLVLSEQVSTPNSNSVLDLESLAPGVRSEAIDNGAGNPAADVTGAGVAAIASSSAEAVERPGGGGDEGQLDNALYRLSCFEDWFADSVQDAC